MDTKTEAQEIDMEGIREYAEGNPVQLVEGNRPRIAAYNEGGYNGTEIDLLDLLGWILKNRPDLIERAKEEL